MRYSLLFAVALLAAFLAAPAAKAQVGLSVQIGPSPVCPYGYFDYPPYPCAPYGYYGPDWFPNGIFIGAGPWFRGGPHFHGYVNNRYDPHRGYHGAMPRRGEHDRWENGHWHGHPHENFHGNEMRDGRGHSMGGGHSEHGDHGHGH